MDKSKMNLLEGCMKAARSNMDMWKVISENETELKARGKTKIEALFLVSYYDGVNDGLVVARSIIESGEGS